MDWSPCYWESVGLLKTIQEQLKEEYLPRVLFPSLHHSLIISVTLNKQGDWSVIGSLPSWRKMETNEDLHDMYTNVRDFQPTQIANKSFVRFPIATLEEAGRNAKKFRKSVDELPNKFLPSFSGLRKKINMSLLVTPCPRSQDSETTPQELQSELIDFSVRLCYKR